MNTDYINEIPEAERRFISSPVEYRENGKEGVIEGVAAVVSTRAGNDWFDEEIKPGAFKNALNDDVRVLFNHNPDKVLGRTKSKTAEIFLKENGDLGYRYKTPQNRQFAKDVEDMIKTGDVNQSSFAFRVKEDEWIEKKGEKPLRVISEIEKLYDVSPVTYPWYSSTSVGAKRSYDNFKGEKNDDYTERMEAIESKVKNIERLQIIEEKINKINI